MSRRELCTLDEIPDPGAKGFDFGSGTNLVSIFVVRAGNTLVAYENACPHTGGPLDWVPDQFLTREKDHILCATHGALFRIATGECLAGPCVGDWLRALPVSLDGDTIVVEL